MVRNGKSVHSSIFPSLSEAEKFKTARLNSIGLTMTHGRGLLHLLHTKLVGGTYDRLYISRFRRRFGELQS